MTNQEILEKAIQKAIDGGYEIKLLPLLSRGVAEMVEHLVKYPEWITHLIFNHDFAKALWSDDLVEVKAYLAWGGDYLFQGPSYLAHLQQMVIAVDPIEYLGANI